MSLFDHPRVQFLKKPFSFGISRSGPPRGIPNPPPCPPPPRAVVRGASATEARVLVRFDLHGCHGSFPECYEAFSSLYEAKQAMDKWLYEGDSFGPDAVIINPFYKIGDEDIQQYGNIPSRFDPLMKCYAKN